MKNKTKLDINTIIRQYNVDNMSTYEIAEYHSTYPQKIRRILNGAGIKLRERGESQSIALKNGRKEHPTAGKGHSVESKIKISESVSASWKGLSEEERNEKISQMRDRWFAIPLAERMEMSKKGHEANREAAIHGSKMEKVVHQHLVEKGFIVTAHKVFKIPGHSLEVDLYLTKENIAIEIDGPSHFFPIWGDDKLLQTIKSDETKNSLLVGGGIKVLRIKNVASSLSEKIKRDVINGIDNGITELINGKNFIEVEIG